MKLIESRILEQQERYDSNICELQRILSFKFGNSLYFLNRRFIGTERQNKKNHPFYAYVYKIERFIILYFCNRHQIR